MDHAKRGNWIQIKISFESKYVKRIQDIQQLDTQQQEYVFALLDAFLRDHKAKKAYAS